MSSVVIMNSSGENTPSTSSAKGLNESIKMFHNDQYGPDIVLSEPPLVEWDYSMQTLFVGEITLTQEEEDKIKEYMDKVYQGLGVPLRIFTGSRTEPEEDSPEPFFVQRLPEQS